ncbi:MAG: hypothetical protein JW782_01170 [Candidatus Saganbacteria bacterium]|nr:hypothetical protein [Candidatus Saganbacteria bacterium]
MKLQRWQIWLGGLLIAMSAGLYYIHYLIFHDAHHIFIYLLGDVAFVPVEVLIVTLIIHEVLSQREKKSRLEKLNMVIGAFFSEVGTHLLTVISDADPTLEEIKKDLKISNNWDERRFSQIERRFKEYDYAVNINKIDLHQFRDFLRDKRAFLLRLLENPNLLEHETFTDLLWAVFHLTEELVARKNIGHVPQTDLDHMSGDIKRVYDRLVLQWLAYMKHLKEHYPYLFSLALRTNPFDETATVEVK